MSLIVQKYGGSSLADKDKIINAAEKIINKYEKGHELVVVASAMGDTTDNLIKKMKKISSEPDPREADMLLTTGEQISIALLTMAIHEKGYPAISLTGSQVGINTDDRHAQAEILNINNERINKELKQNKIVVVAGFQGINSREDYTTLGRGGSDTTAVALAVSLNAEKCEIYSDVDGIYSADPQIVEKAVKLKNISYEEMLELANLGAEVLHPRAVELARAHKLPLYLASSFNNKTGTVIKELKKMEKRKNVTGVTSDKNEVKITVEEVPDRPGIAGMLFSKLAEENINVDMIIQNLQHHNLNDITFTVNKEELKKSKDIIKEVAGELNAGEILIDEKVAKVSIVGAGMISTPGIAARMFRILGKNNINIQMITTSDIKISCLIKDKLAEKAVKSIHEDFDLALLEK